MRSILLIYLISLSTLFSSPLKDYPEPVFKIEIPPIPSKEFGKYDLSQHDVQFLSSTASKNVREGKLDLAIQFQYWAHQANKNDGLYELACYYSLNKNIDASVYYLQKAAISEGTFYDFVIDDEDLIPVMNSKYWEQLRPWLKKCSYAWRNSGYSRINIIEPQNKISKILLIGLHGYGSKPEDFASPDDQEFANKHQVTFVGISASLAMENNSFMWSENIPKDYKHITKLLKTKGINLATENRTIILIGFSQGAQLSTEILARHPNLFKGIIALCPGAKYDSQLHKAKPKPNLGQKKAVIICGAEEHSGNLKLSKSNFEWLRQHKAKVSYTKIEGMGHSFPNNYYLALEDYLSYVLNDKVSNQAN
ncbi:hypothetical protein LNTAR_05226 [Lentisphaera araneosa HTCC2155]|uniref:Phospholipase/carboxylesterase/thioesterase domain-containing protein n=2 Tax=Lentisphaera TaxID=256846 RepID=A6DLN2_9BACT|nr:hypothetical protein LNTAR_05226 [Lentisphaera araneosa HTCC2155]